MCADARPAHAQLGLSLLKLVVEEFVPIGSGSGAALASTHSKLALSPGRGDVLAERLRAL